MMRCHRRAKKIAGVILSLGLLNMGSPAPYWLAGGLARDHGTTDAIELIARGPLAVASALLGALLNPPDASAQTFEIMNKLLVDGSSTFKGATLFVATTAPSAYAGNGTIYYDKTANALEASNNGGSFGQLTLQGNTFNGASELVQLNGSSQLPAVSGALLTNLPWGSLTGFPAACSLGQYVSAVGGTLTCGTPAGTGITGSGSLDYLAKFTGSGSIGNSLIYDNGTNVGISTAAPIGFFTLVQAGSGWDQGIDIANAAGSNIWRLLSDSNSTLFSITPNESYANGISIEAANGNVGIGTSGPTNKLYVNGGTTINGNLTLSPANPSITSGSGYITIPNGLFVSGGTPYFANQMQARGGIHNDNAAYLELDGGTGGNTYINGNLGIGTSSPGGVFDVVSSSSNQTNCGAESATCPSAYGPGWGTVLDSDYTNGQYRYRIFPIDRGGNISLYIQEAAGTANDFSNLARFGNNQYDSNNFEVFGNSELSGTTFFGTGSTYQVTSVGATTLALSQVSNLELNNGANNAVDIDAPNISYTSTGRIDFSTGSISGGIVQSQVVASIDGKGDFTAKGTVATNGSPDLAEFIQTVPGVSAGDVVAPDERPARVPGPGGERIRVERADEPYEPGMLGVISDGSSSFLIGSHLHGVNAGSYPGEPLVLAGRVPVKVDMEGGPIRIGDYLTSSSRPGYAMKATKPGPTVGIALEDFSGKSDAAGKILCFVHVGENASLYTQQLERQQREINEQNKAIFELRTQLSSLKERLGAGK